MLSNMAAIESVFRNLEERGILARADFWDCNTCATEALVNTELPAWGDTHVSGPEHQPIGYVFFHQQATDSANEGYSLLLSHGSFNEAEDGVPEHEIEHAQQLVANTIVEEFREHGFLVDWHGDLNVKIPVLEPRGGWNLNYYRDHNDH
jgi:uncharacterized protein DUF6891